MAAIYDAFDYMNSNEYEKELEKKSDNFLPMGSINPETNIRTSPIGVPPAAVKSAMRVSVKRAETPATTTARKAIIQQTPIIFKQKPYDYELNRPRIQRSPITTKSDNSDDWSSIYDDDFRGGKKRTRRTRSTRRKPNRKARFTRRKRTKMAYLRRRRSRKIC
jgi:hypothetical protein